MPNYKEIARQAIDKYLRENSSKKVVLFWSLTAIADCAAFNAGKKRELFPSLFDYECLLPPGTKTLWSNNAYSAINPYCSLDIPVKKDTTFLPGFFDAAVDMGSDAWSTRLKGAE